MAMPNNLQGSASIDLPSIHISANYDPDEISHGQMLHATAVIGIFKNSLSTTLLNHVIIIQKVFMTVSSTEFCS